MKIGNLRDKINEANKDDIFRLLSLASQRAGMGRGPIGQATDDYDTIKRSEFNRILTSRGFEVIGRGFFSTAWARPGSDKVIKIVYPGGEEVDCSASFLKLARRHNVNKHFPRVYNYRYLNDRYRNDEETLVVVTEKLYPFDVTKIRWTKDASYNLGFLSLLIRNGIVNILSEKYLKDFYRNLIPKSRYEKILQKDDLEELKQNKPMVSAIRSINYDLKDVWREDYNHTSFIKALNILEVLRDKCPGTFIDWKKENVMMRGDGTIVLNDPLAF